MQGLDIPFLIDLIFMQEEFFKYSRKPNVIEQFIIERCVRNTRIVYIEAFILFLACDLAVWYLTILFFSESILMGLLMLIFASGIGIFLILILAVIKDARIKSYQIISDQGAWSSEFEGEGKTRHLVSKVNGAKICMVVPGMALAPKYGEIQNIEYEYVKVFEFPPPFGYDNIFISIERKGFTQKHKTYIEKLKPIGLLSIVISILFCVNLLFCFLTEFDIPWISYLCLGLFLIFGRTIIIWVHNNELHKRLNIKAP